MGKTWKDRKTTSEPKIKTKLRKVPRDNRHFYSEELFQKLVEEYDDDVDEYTVEIVPEFVK